MHPQPKLRQNPTFMESLKRFRRPRPHSPAVMRLVNAPRKLSRIGSSFRWRPKADDQPIPSVINTGSRNPFVRDSVAECRDDGPTTTSSYASTPSLIDECSEELEEETPNSFISLEPPDFTDYDNYTEETDDETSSEPSEDDKEGPETPTEFIDDGPPVTKGDSRQVSFAPTYKEIRFRKYDNPRAVWFSREDRKKTINQCASEIASCVGSEPKSFRALVDHCKGKKSAELCEEFRDVMYVRGLLRPCLTRVSREDKVVRDWVQTPKRSVAAVLRVQQQGGTNLADIYRTFTEPSVRWAHYLAIADAIETERKSPYEKVLV